MKSTPGSFVATVLTRFGVTVQESPARPGTRSAADVHAARTAAGHPVYLKLTRTAQGPDAMAAARRELRFYRDIGPAAPLRTAQLLDAMDTDEGVAILLESVGEPLPPGSWTPAMWAALGQDLAALHSIRASGWQRPDGLRLAMADPDLPAIAAFWDPVLPRLADLLAGRAGLERQMDLLPPVFVHGDCHTGNITH